MVVTRFEGLRSSLPYRALRSVRYLVPSRPRPAILMYHRIADETFDPWALAVAPRHFADQISWIAKSRTVLPLPQFAELHRRGALPDNAIAITFDDAYACSAAVAAPLLEKLRIPATIFAPVELVERASSFWWHELERIVLDSASRSLELDGISVDIGPGDSRDGHWQAGAPPKTPRQAAFLHLWARIRERPAGQADQAIESLREQSGVAPRQDLKRAMNRAEIRSVASDTIEIGSHSLTHRSLPRLSRREKAIEIGESVERCEALTGRKPRSFAYPFGEFDRESEDLVSKAGFECACSAEHRWATPGSGTYALPRLAVGNRGKSVLRRVLKYPPQ